MLQAKCLFNQFLFVITLNPDNFFFFSCKVHTYLFNITGWCVAIILALSTLYGQYKVLRKDDPQPFSPVENIMYGTFSRFAWSLALAWVIFACQRGLGGKCYSFFLLTSW